MVHLPAGDPLTLETSTQQFWVLSLSSEEYSLIQALPGGSLTLLKIERGTRGAVKLGRGRQGVGGT